MKQLLYTAFIVISLTGFSQEKKGICESRIQFTHQTGADISAYDGFLMNGYSPNQAIFHGSFQVDSTAIADSLIYEITLPFGDSLTYHAFWMADGMCYGIDTAHVNALITILEGVPFSITHGGYYSVGYYDVYQDGIIRDSCFLRIEEKDLQNRFYFVRVRFLDPPVTANIPELTNDITMWFSNETTLMVKADEGVFWKVNLYSLSGELVQVNELEGVQNLDLSRLARGCYVVHVSGENGITKQLKFIR